MPLIQLFPVCKQNKVCKNNGNNLTRKTSKLTYNHRNFTSSMSRQLLRRNSQRTQERKTSKRNRDSKRSLYTLHVSLKYPREHICMEDIPQVRSARQQHQAGINSRSCSR
jgi:hypothetical protein